MLWHYWTGHWKLVSRQAHHIWPLSMFSQCMLVTGWGLKWRLILPSGPVWLCKDFTFYYLFFIYYCMFSWLLVRPQRTPERTPLENNSRYYSSCIVHNVMLQVLKLLSSVCLCYMHVLVSAASCIINDRPLVLWHCWFGHLTRKTRPRYDL